MTLREVCCQLYCGTDGESEIKISQQIIHPVSDHRKSIANQNLFLISLQYSFKLKQADTDSKYWKLIFMEIFSSIQLLTILKNYITPTRNIVLPKYIFFILLWTLNKSSIKSAATALRCFWCFILPNWRCSCTSINLD